MSKFKPFSCFSLVELCLFINWGAKNKILTLSLVLITILNNKCQIFRLDMIEKNSIFFIFERTISIIGLKDI